MQPLTGVSGPSAENMALDQKQIRDIGAPVYHSLINNFVPLSVPNFHFAVESWVMFLLGMTSFRDDHIVFQYGSTLYSPWFSIYEESSATRVNDKSKQHRGATTLYIGSTFSAFLKNARR